MCARGIEGYGAEKGGKASFLTSRGAGREEAEGEISTPRFSLFLSVARTSKPVGDRRVAINAVELTPGCPFAGKVRLKESRNGRQLPRSELARGRRGREGESARASMSITPAGRASRLYFALFAFAFRLASARASYSSTLMTVLFLTDVLARGAAYNNIETSYSR